MNANHDKALKEGNTVSETMDTGKQDLEVGEGQSRPACPLKMAIRYWLRHFWDNEMTTLQSHVLQHFHQCFTRDLTYVDTR